MEVYNSNIHRTYGSYPIFANQWGTICDSRWTVQDATVVCHSLGYYFNETDLQVNQLYGLGTGPIWTRYITCSGREYYTWECYYSLNYGYSLPRCNHSMDIGITCSGILTVDITYVPCDSYHINAYCNLLFNSHSLFSNHPQIIVSGYTTTTVLNATLE